MPYSTCIQEFLEEIQSWETEMSCVIRSVSLNASDLKWCAQIALAWMLFADFYQIHTRCSSLENCWSWGMQKGQFSLQTRKAPIQVQVTQLVQQLFTIWLSKPDQQQTLSISGFRPAVATILAPQQLSIQNNHFKTLQLKLAMNSMMRCAFLLPVPLDTSVRIHMHGSFEWIFD